MPAFDKGTGSASLLRIYDNGSTAVEFLIFSGDPATWSGGVPWSGRINGVNVGGSRPITSGRGWYSCGTWAVSTAQTAQFNIGASGTSGIGGPTNHSAWIARGTVPPAPSPLAFGAITPTSIVARFQSNGEGGGGTVFSRWESQYSTSPTFASGNSGLLVSTGTVTGSPLTPGTTYYWRHRGVNNLGAGPWSTTSSATTLPSSAPTFTVTPSADGASATLALTPPGGASGVTAYLIEYQQLPGGPVQTASGATPRTVTGLQPGRIYQWRAAAQFGAAYTSPWSAWTLAAQPDPNQVDATWFDGYTSPRDGFTFGWNGAAGASSSYAAARTVKGWGGGLLPDAVGSVPVVFGAEGGRSGDGAARAVFGLDEPTGGAYVGLSGDGAAAIVEYGTYAASIYARPPREQRLAAVLIWEDDIGAAVGAPIIGPGAVAPGGAWTRVSIVAVAPEGAAYARVAVVAVPGAGFDPWKSAEYIDADDAAITLAPLVPYFDGSTTAGDGFSYEWDGSADDSESVRLLAPNLIVDPLLDPDCPPIPAPPQAPALVDECVIEVGTWRRYWLTVPAAEIADWLTDVLTLTLSTGAEAEREVRIRTYSNPLGLPPYLMQSAPEGELVVRYIPPGATVELDGVSSRAIASVDGQSGLAADHLVYGPQGGPPTWPVLRCGAGYLISLDVPLDAPWGNLDARLELTRRMG